MEPRRVIVTLEFWTDESLANLRDWAWWRKELVDDDANFHLEPVQANVIEGTKRRVKGRSGSR